MISLSDFFTVWDYILLPAYALVAFIIANRIKQNHFAQHPEYKYFTIGLFVKILGGIVFNLIYYLHYHGGDTSDYFWSAKVINRLLFKESSAAIDIILGQNTAENYNCFDWNIGFPSWNMYFFKPDSFLVIRLMSPILLASANCLLTGTLVLDCLAYIGIWKLYRVMCGYYPSMTRLFAFAILFFPSVVFWSSGIMKDTFTFSATLWFIANVHYIFIRKKKILTNILLLFINAALIISIKPYILLALIPSSLIWISYRWARSLQSAPMRMLITPFMILFGFGAAFLLINSLGSRMGAFSSVQGIFDKAQMTQQDLVREELYGEHYYDIGGFDKSVGGLLAKMPQALIAGLFRPFLWDARNWVMAVSGLENFALMIVSVFILFKVGIVRTIRFINDEPLVLFSFVFAIIFAFSVGLTTGNYGAMVRYRIPALPFFAMGLLLLLARLKTLKAEAG